MLKEPSNQNIHVRLSSFTDGKREEKTEFMCDLIKWKEKGGRSKIWAVEEELKLLWMKSLCKKILGKDYKSLREIFANFLENFIRSEGHLHGVAVETIGLTMWKIFVFIDCKIQDVFEVL